MKKLLFIFATILIALSAQAQTRYQLQAGDIVTISRVNGTTRNYLTVNENNGLVVHNEPNDNSLWVIHTCSYASSKNQYTLKHYKTGRYLQITGKKQGNRYTITPSLITNESPTILYQDRPSVGENGVYEEGELYFLYDKRNHELSVNNSNAWVFQQGGNQALQVEKWERQSSTDFASYFSPETYDFNLVTSANKDINNENIDADTDIAQQRNVRFVVDLRVSNYLACKHKDSNGNPTSDKHLDEKVEVDSDLNYIDLTPTFQWSSNKGAGVVSSLPASGTTGYLKNYLYEANEHSRGMLQFQKGNISSDNLAYELTLQSLGTSPIGLKRQIATGVTSWVNYVDYLVASWEYGGNTYTDSMRVIRKSYHTKPLPEFEFSVSPSTYTFDADAGSQTFTIKGTHQHGTGYYDVDARLVDTKLIYGPVDMPLKDDEGKLEYKFSCLDRNSEAVSDWLSVGTIDAINNTITLNAEENGNGYRQARLIVEVDLKQTQTGIDDPHNTIRAININQRSDQGTIDFYHQEGASYKNKDNDPQNDLKNNRQQVHTAERIIYYQPGQNIELRLAESNFFGYMRWYDYDSNGDGGDPMWHNEENKRTTWVTSPRGANGNAFRAINTSIGNSRGLYATAQDGQLTSNSENNPAPVLKGWDYGTYDPNAPTEEQKTKAIHTIACDVSAYTDYTLTDNGRERTSITEPTLSYRQLFHLRPAEEIAAKLNTNSAADKYLENYHYMAAVGADVHLATQFRYTKYTHESELCYFYLVQKQGGGQETKRVGKDAQAKWYKKNGENWEEVTNPNYQVYDYLNVDSDTEGVQVYALKVPAASTGLGTDLLIAQFEINFVDINSCGPRTTPIITDHEMELHFQLIKKIDFNYPGNAVTYDGTLKQLDAHLPWDESSYAYYYPKTGNENLGQTSPNRSGQNIPYYGEYFLVNQINKDWAKATAHGGTNDYALYVDGTTEPGLVASISTDNVICAGQTLYCSVWLNNPCPTNFSYNNPRNPIFRCNVQGKRKDVQGNWSDWEDISVFFVGQLPKGSGWQQVVFPVTSDYTYDETRVSIYNFATGGAGNDFMVDDITLFASRLPLASYQAQTNCASDANTPSSTAAILRIDYTVFEGIADHYMYYQIYNTSEDHVVELTKLDNTSAYYHDVDGETDRTYGSVQIPNKTFDPETFNASASEQEKVLIFPTVQSFKDHLVDQVTTEKPHVKGKAYIRSTIKGQERWLLYVMHIIPNNQTDGTITQEIEKKYLWERYNYALRMANVPEELAAAECNMQTPLHATQATHFDLYNGYKEQKANNFIPESANNCANDYYTLQAKIENSISPGTGGTIQQIEGAVMGDWLVGYPFDDVYTNTETRNDDSHKESIEAARTLFKETYGYYREEVTSAIVYDLRRNDPANTNRLVTKFEELDANAFEYPARNYTIIKDLYEKGLLILGQSQTSFYLASKETARYWFFPIDGTATGTMKDANGNDVTVMLQDCTEPIWVRVSTQEQPNYFANIAPLKKEKQTSLQKFQLPTVRITKAQADNGTITIPVTEIGDQTTLAGLADNKITINLKNLGQDVAFVNIENGTDITTTPELVIGQKYLMRMRMKDGDNVYIGGNSEDCRVGTIYFYLTILPNTVVWTPATGSYNGWGLDENWRGWNDKDADGGFDAGELMEVGFVPVAGSDVIIPTLPDVTLYPYIHDHNHYPMDVNAHPSICNDVYFAPGAIIHNQHLLQYNRAFVDMTIPKGNWYMMSAPLQKMYSGDMYVPHEGTYEGGRSLEIAKPFETGAFQGERRSTSAYAFWASYYNQSVKTWYEDGGYIESTSSSFQQSNGLNQPLEVGSGFALWGEGADVDATAGENIVIRLPKQEDTYLTSSENQVSVPRTDAEGNKVSHKLAFTATQDTEENITPMTITLTNKKASEHFIFGNPTMAFINMHDFLHDNEGVLNHTFYRLEGATWTAETEYTMTDNRYLAPMTSVMLETKDKSKETKLSVQLSPLHLTLTDLDDPFSEENPEIKPVAPRTKVSEEGASEVMNIYAYTNDAYARTVLATTPLANDYYLIGEDALFVSSGIESDSYVLTPLNMYTVAEQVPMMADVRQGISQIPLSVLVASDYRTTHMQLAFYLSSNWTRECYFYDSQTGQKIRIMDGLVITVEMPQNHEQRYFIEGPDEYLGSSEDPQGPTTAVDNTSSSVLATLQAFSLAQGELTIGSNQLIQEIRLYDLAGRLILDNSLTLLHTTTTVTAPSGICLVEAVLRDGTTLHTQALVK